MKSYKNTSRTITLIAGVCTCITIIGADQLINIIGIEYASIITLLVTVAGYISAQLSEEIRVPIAVERAINTYNEGVDDDT